MADRKKTGPNLYVNTGRIPPQATEIEEMVLGAILLEYNKIPIGIWGSLKPELFYIDAHSKIFTEILNLRNDKKPVDPGTVASALTKAGNLEMIGGRYALTTLLDRVASSANIEYHVLLIHQAYLKRELIRIGTECVNNMYDDTGDVFTQIASIITDVKNIEKGIFKRSEKDANALVDEIIEEMDKPKQEGLLGLSTGLKGLDFVLKGDKEGDLRVIGGETSSGKSILMCTEILNDCFNERKELLEDQIPTAVFSLEMPSKQLTFREISNLSSISNTKIKLNKLLPDEKTRLLSFLELFRKSKIFIDDTPGLSINEFETKAAILVAIHGVKKIFIDYFQLMKGDPNKKYGTRENELSDISRRLKTVAKELCITIIVYSQLGPEVQKRPLCIPTKNDLRECKALAHDADVLIFVYRPEYYEHILKELSDNQKSIYCKLFNISINDFNKMCFLIVDKNRDGELGKIPMAFNAELMRISDHWETLGAIELLNAAENDAQFQMYLSEVQDAF